MKQLLEFVPLVLFFIFFKLYDIYTGVAVLMAASTVAILLAKWLVGKVEKMMLFTYVMVMLFGALTLYFNNDLFIKWKVTIIYVVFALILSISQFILKKNVLQSMIGKELKLPDEMWHKLTLGWIGFFLFCALLNVYVMFTFSQADWVNFKTFWLTGLTLLFTLINGVFLYRHLAKPSAE